MRKTDDECSGCINANGDDCTVDAGTFDMRLSEHGTCYQISKKQEIAARLARLAVEMNDIATEMEYCGGLALWAAKAKELHGAARMAVDWSSGILEEG